MVSMLVGVPSCCIASMFTYILNIWEGKNKKNKTRTIMIQTFKRVSFRSGMMLLRKFYFKYSI